MWILAAIRKLFGQTMWETHSCALFQRWDRFRIVGWNYEELVLAHVHWL